MTTMTGTAVGQEPTWTVDPPEWWTVVPTTRSESAGAIAAWQDGVVEAVRRALELRIAEDEASEGDAPGDEISAEERAELHQQVAAAVENLRTYADEVPEGTRVVALLGLRDHGPVPVLVSVAAGEPDAPDDALLRAVGATGGTPFEAPNVEYLDLPDGDGVRVTRLDIAPDGSAWLSIGLGRRTETSDGVVDTVILWRTQDLFIVDTVSEALDELLPAVRTTGSAT
ncbi:hypothetical protein ACIG47_16375 [Promicromonospora sp. NPDC052451]|uniref:hypothetical protein n=1 Tax=Promicromonospora sp. NPDC052451 TaxID=3364407 RepID=UPI0037C67B26